MDLVPARRRGEERETTERRRDEAAPVTPESTRGKIQGAVLIGACCMPILGSTSIAPLQPAMAGAFPDQPGARVLVSMILTVPALVIGLTAIGAGRFVDSIGRKRVIVVALLLYAVFGSAPLWLPTLPLILASRVGVGLAESAIFAAAMTMIADLFVGDRRARYFAGLNIVTGLAAVVFIGVSGALGQSNWRSPFLLYLLALPLCLAAVVVLPAHARADTRAVLPRVDWRALAKPMLFTFVGGAVFYVPVAMLSLRLDDIGITAASTIGIVSAIGALALALSAMSFPVLLRSVPHILLWLAFGLLGIGLLVIGAGQALAALAVGAIVANAGGGLLLTTLQNWIVQGVPFAQRGRVSGASTSTIFVGQFFAPLVVLALAVPLSLGAGIAVAGAVGLAMAVIAGRTTRMTPNAEVDDAFVLGELA